MKSFLTTLGVVVIGIAMIAVIGLLTGAFVMLLWNWLMPSIFGLKTISYLQGWGLTVLFSLLFKPSSQGENGR